MMSFLGEGSETSIDLNQNAFLLIHGWTVTPLLLESLPLLSQLSSDARCTAAQLAEKSGANAGPLQVALRSWGALGVLKLEPGTIEADVAYSLDAESNWKALAEVLQAEKEKILEIYSKAQPPFKIPSEASQLCLDLWRHLAGLSSRSSLLFLQGVALAPLLTSMTYHARWNEEGLDLGRDKAFSTFDFSSLDVSALKTMGDIFQALGIGKVDSSGQTEVWPQGYLGLQRVYSYYVPTSYAPLLGHFHHVLFDDASWGFNGDVEDEDDEIHVHRTLNVVGSGAQHGTLFKDLLQHVHQVFADDKFDEQPQFVIDTGCGDGHLLQCIYEHVKNHTPRGKVLDSHPLTMVGVDFNEKARIATACNLDAHAVPHRVVSGDIGKPSALMAQLKRKKVNTKKALHVRSFLDHDRPYIPAKMPIPSDSALAAFVRNQLADFVHLDKEGTPIGALELFASLVEHMARWAEAVEDSFGLCMLEVMQLNLPSTRRFMNDCVSFHFDIVQSLSRQYMVSAVSFAMSCAMAGLFPSDCRSVQTYPETGGYCRMMNQHLVRKAFRLRLAERSDLPALLALEEKAWQQLAASEEVLRQRLDTSREGNFLLELEGEVAAVLYTQRIRSVEDVASQKFLTVSESHDPCGGILQLIALSSDPQIAHGMGLGAELRSFALLLAKLDPSIDLVIGVTRCSEFEGSDLAKYVADHQAGGQTDKTLSFHTGYGAEILRLVPDFRPEDLQNQGTGVLIQYDVNSWTPLLPDSHGSHGSNGSADPPPAPAMAKGALQALREVLEEMQHPLEDEKLELGFFVLGLDSLELSRVRSRMSEWAGRPLPATFLFDFPSVSEAAAELEKMKGTVSQHGTALEAIKEIFLDLKCPLSEEQSLQGFLQLGIDSLELVRIKNRLSKWLGHDLPATFLLDFPSVAELATELDRRAGAATNGKTNGVTNGATNGGYHGTKGKEEVKLVVEKELLIQVQQKLKEKYSSAQHQRKISGIMEKSAASKSSYMKALEPLRMEVEGSVLFSLGIIDDLQPKSVETGRKDVEKSLKKFRSLPEVSDCEQEVLKVLHLQEAT